jgi:hypothetical protein
LWFQWLDLEDTVLCERLDREKKGREVEEEEDHHASKLVILDSEPLL